MKFRKSTSSSSCCMLAVRLHEHWGCTDEHGLVSDHKRASLVKGSRHVNRATHWWSQKEEVSSKKEA